ncbi:MAG: transposase, family [Mucilaginibacter sp.]|nr:transposase, family [Mucilaginibacter sp.]
MAVRKPVFKPYNQQQIITILTGLGALKRQTQKAYILLNSEEGIKRRKKRCFDVELVFENVKQNHGSEGLCFVVKKK